jgi:hypothetical protein
MKKSGRLLPTTERCGGGSRCHPQRALIQCRHMGHTRMPDMILHACSGITWLTKDGLRKPNYFGSITQSATCRVGNFKGEEVHVPFKGILPMVDPNDIVIGGWDISSMNLADAMERAKVFDYELQQQLAPYMKDTSPLPGIYDPKFIAANQAERADHTIPGTKREQVDVVRQQMREFKAQHSLEKIIVLWTANTERYAEVRAGLNDSTGAPSIRPATLQAKSSCATTCLPPATWTVAERTAGTCSVVPGLCGTGWHTVAVIHVQP